MHAAMQPVVSQIARDALALGVGAPMPPVALYQQRLNVGASTVQRAFEYLSQQEALSVSSHGHLGRRLQLVEVGKLWRLGGFAPVRLLLPPDGSIEFAVLGAEIMDQLLQRDVPFGAVHMRGGYRRLASLERGAHDMAIASRGTASEARFRGAQAKVKREFLTRELESGTYYGESRLVVVTRVGWSPCGSTRVAVDRDSPDHLLLSQAEFGAMDEVVFVDRDFPMVPAAVLRNEADVGIWHIAHTVIPLELAGLAIQPLKEPKALRIAQEISAAVLVVLANRPELSAVLSCLDLRKVLPKQQRLLALPDNHRDIIDAGWGFGS